MATVFAEIKCGKPTTPINTLRYLATRSVWRKCSLQAEKKKIQGNCPHPLRPHGLIHRGDAVMCISRRHSEGIMEKKKKKKQTRFKKLNRNTWRVVNKWQITGLFVFVLKDQLPGKWELMEREVEVVWVTQLKVSLGSILCFSLLNTCWRLFSVLGVQSEAHSFLRYIENFHPSRCGRVIPREWSLLTLMARSDGFRFSVSITVACSYICKVSPPSGWIVTALTVLWLFIYSVFTWVSPKLWYTTRSFKTNDIPASFEFSANCQRWGSKW